MLKMTKMLFSAVGRIKSKRNRYMHFYIRSAVCQPRVFCRLKKEKTEVTVGLCENYGGDNVYISECRCHYDLSFKTAFTIA